MSADLDVLVAGEVYVDLILSNFDIWPTLGQEAFAQEFRREAGGGTAITACGLGRLGLRTGVLAGVGAQDGDWLLSRLAAASVDVSRTRLDETEPTGFTLVATLPQDRTFLTYRGANRRFEEYLIEAVKAGSLKDVRHLHLALAPKLEEAKETMGLIRQNGCTISLDTGWNEAWLSDSKALEVLKQVDLFFPNEAEAGRLTGETEPTRMLKTFSDAGINRVALKLGSAGCALLWDGDIFLEHALKVTSSRYYWCRRLFRCRLFICMVRVERTWSLFASCKHLRCVIYAGVWRIDRLSNHGATRRKTNRRETMRKVTIVGGGGVRTPLVLFGLAQAQERLGINEVVLFDIDEERTETIARGWDAKRLASSGSPLQLKLHLT